MPSWSVAVVTPPAEEPVTLAEARLHLRVDATGEDALITALIQAAREWCEQHTGRAFVTQTLRYRLAQFPRCRTVELPRGPAQSITSVGYVDPALSVQTLDAAKYGLAADASPPRLELAPSLSWPDTYDAQDAVTITYVAGYGAASAVPFPIKQAILVMVGELYSRREDAVAGMTIQAAQMGVERLLAPYRIMYA